MRLQRSLLGAVVAMTLAVPVGSSLGSASGATLTSCSVSTLSTSVGRGSAAAGTAYVTLVLKDHDKGTNALTGVCALSGTPVTQFGNFVNSGNRLAEFVGVGPTSTKLTFSDRGKNITLKPGAVASVTVGIETAGNYEPSTCREANVSRVRLIFNSGATFYFVLRRTQVCTKLASTTTSGVVLGTRFQ